MYFMYQDALEVLVWGVKVDIYVEINGPVW
jgi:hypothetical protein